MKKTKKQKNKRKILTGLINNQGEWIIEPTFEKRLAHNSQNFFHSLYEQEQKNYWLNTDEKKLIAVNFSPSYYLDDNLIEVLSSSKDSKNRNGVFNLEKQKLIIPANNSELWYKNNIISVEKELADGSQSYSAYDTKGNIILSGQPSQIKIESDYLYTTTFKEGSRIAVRKAFNRKGKQLTQQDWSELGTYSSDNLQVVEKCNLLNNDGHEYKKCIYGVINHKGETAFKADQYKYILPFSKGLAAAQNKEGLWGYINNKGNTAIPFKFKSAGSFKFKYALVTFQNGDDALINNKGKLFKNFKDTLIQTNSSSDPEVSTVYTLKNGKKYNDKGEPVN